VNAGRRRTKIVCTIGPASSTVEVVSALVDAGTDAARLNFSHGTHAEHAERARLVRETQARVGRPLALIADLQGPKLRLGELHWPVTLAAGQRVTIAGESVAADGELPVAPAVLFDALEPGHEVLIDDGLVRLRVKKASEELTKVFEALVKKMSAGNASPVLGEISDDDIDNLFND
jgi:pyruvate kinase